MSNVDVPATVSEGARITGWSEDTVRRKFDAGEIPGVRTTSGLRLLERAALEALAAERQRRTFGRSTKAISG
jgi:excisionase family DNA binding protein